MTNDAKLGLVIGVGLVITVAVVFFRKDLATATPSAGESSSVAVSPAHPASSGTSPGIHRPVNAHTATRTQASLAGQHHVVEDGETLFSLAQRYYGDRDKFMDIYRVNREVIPAPDQLTPGTVLTIPDLSDHADDADEQQASLR